MTAPHLTSRDRAVVKAHLVESSPPEATVDAISLGAGPIPARLQDHFAPYTPPEGFEPRVNGASAVLREPAGHRTWPTFTATTSVAVGDRGRIRETTPACG